VKIDKSTSQALISERCIVKNAFNRLVKYILKYCKLKIFTADLRIHIYIIIVSNENHVEESL